LIRYAQQAGAAPIFLSSDAVFAGELLNAEPRPKTETDRVGPITAYGRQKQAVEQALLSSNGTILRLSKLVSTRPEDGGFLCDLAAQLLRGERVRAATDQFMNLTSIEDVARVVGFVVAENLSGLWHVAAAPVRSRYDWSVARARTSCVRARSWISSFWSHVQGTAPSTVRDSSSDYLGLFAQATS
jgi:dTDP-4-dehydrorhamnose reductase